jgi:hypothetical protein
MLSTVGGAGDWALASAEINKRLPANQSNKQVMALLFKLSLTKVRCITPLILQNVVIDFILSDI